MRCSMIRTLVPTLLICLIFSGCGSGSGVTVVKGETIPFLSKTMSKTKDWFTSKNNESTTPLPPSPLHIQPNTSRGERKNSKNQRMGVEDYTTAINRLKQSTPELKNKFGQESMEVAENYHTIGAMYSLQGQKSDARFYFKKALPIFSSWLGSEHPRVWKLRRQMERLN